MVRILYGVAGEGFGHSSRSSLIGKRLLDAGHEVLFAASRKSAQYLSQYFPDRIRQVYGLHFIFERGKIRPLRTFWSNLAGYRKGMGTNHRLFQEVKSFAPDIVLSDFEPFTAWWAWRNRIPCISMDHEHMLTLCRLEKIPDHRMDRFMAAMITRGYHTWADAYIILNFFRVPLKNSTAVLTPPVIRETVEKIWPWKGEHITLYSTDTSPDIREHLCSILRQFPKQRFFIYGFNINREEDNLLFKKTSTEGFICDLAGCRGVVASAGFSLISESLHFRKKMLLIPVKGQFEQIINAHYVQKSGWGYTVEELTLPGMELFLNTLEQSPQPENSIILRPDNEKFFQILEQTFRNSGLEISLAVQSPDA